MIHIRYFLGGFWRLTLLSLWMWLPVAIGCVWNADAACEAAMAELVLLAGALVGTWCYFLGRSALEGKKP